MMLLGKFMFFELKNVGSLDISIDQNEYINLTIRFYKGLPTKYSRGYKPKETIFEFWIHPKTMRGQWYSYDKDYTEYYFLDYYGYYEIRDELMLEKKYDQQDFINEWMRRTHYQIPVKECRKFFGL